MASIDKQELSSVASPNPQDFYLWLTNVPLGVLYKIYKQHSGRRGSSIPSGSTITNGNVPVIQREKIVLRKSVFILVLTIINIEILFDVLYFILRLPPMYISFPSFIQIQLPMLYFFLLIGINVFKFLFIIYSCIKWVTTVYEIKDGEIKFKRGILSIDQKTFLCRHTQEVICRQGLIGKLFNFGSIEIYDPTLTTNISLDSIQNPCRYAEIIRKSLSYADQELIPLQQKEEVLTSPA